MSLQPGSTKYNEAIAKLETDLKRPLTQCERDYLRKECVKANRIERGSGKTRARNAKTFKGQGRTFAKHCRVAELPLDWQNGRAVK